MMNLARRLLVLNALALLTLYGCAQAPVDSGRDSDAVVVTQGSASQWTQFGVLLAVMPIQLTGSDGKSEAGMRMDIVLDDGSSLVVEQALSQAGELHEGNRVKVLRIGGYSRVTFWPYQKGAE
ncbi:MAG: hypothetical protein V7752_14080 [Halopseudomonas sp.]